MAENLVWGEIRVGTRVLYEKGSDSPDADLRRTSIANRLLYFALLLHGFKSQVGN